MRGRIEALDALRGIAALVVVIHHSVLALPGTTEDASVGVTMRWVYATPLRLLLDGTGAVVLFFVLSGLVLAESAARLSYAEFVVRRVCRIWLPFAAAILAAALLAHLAPAGLIPGFSDWFNTAWLRPPQPLAVAKLLAMGGALSLDSPAWTLVHEMRISLVLPLLALLALRSARGAIALSVCASAAALYAINTIHMSGLASSLLATVAFTPMFVLGIGLAKRLEQAMTKLGLLGSWPRAALWLLALGGLAIVPTGTTDLAVWPIPLLLAVCGLAAALLMMLSISGKGAAKVLDTKLPRFLGRISYSLYLIHVVMIEAVGRMLHGVLPPVASILVAVALSVILADLCQRWVETPATDLGRRLGRRFRAHPLHAERNGGAPVLPAASEP